jgi:hypothetical protein
MNHYLDLAIASGLLFNAITLANAQGVAPSELPETTCFHQTTFRIPKKQVAEFRQFEPGSQYLYCWV